jgi:hypothetical protein
MGKFADLKKADSRQVIIDFPYDDQEIKVCLKVLPIMDDLMSMANAREYAVSKGVKNPDESNADFKLREMADIVYRCTYECERDGVDEAGVTKWRSTNRRFFENADEIIENLDQDLLHYLHEYFQNFKSLTSKTQEFNIDNIVRISAVLGGEGDAKSKADFFSALPRHVVFNYLLFSAKALLNSPLARSKDGSSAIQEHIEPIQA